MEDLYKVTKTVSVSGKMGQFTTIIDRSSLQDCIELISLLHILSSHQKCNEVSEYSKDQMDFYVQTGKHKRTWFKVVKI